VTIARRCRGLHETGVGDDERFRGDLLQGFQGSADLLYFDWNPHKDGYYFILGRTDDRDQRPVPAQR